MSYNFCSLLHTFILTYSLHTFSRRRSTTASWKPENPKELEGRYESRAPKVCHIKHNSSHSAVVLCLQWFCFSSASLSPPVLSPVVLSLQRFYLSSGSLSPVVLSLVVHSLQRFCLSSGSLSPVVLLISLLFLLLLFYFFLLFYLTV